MKELAIGETGLYFGKKVRCVAYSDCVDCIFFRNGAGRCKPFNYCFSSARSDKEIVMFIAADQELCRWTEDPDGIWQTSCGQAQEFTTGTREENGYKFCPYCGKLLEAKEYEE